ncbi:hypothetical protein [Salinibacter ruber]|uniref:hypothetical protein n=1 Tax=Salinibacter ruber TaxID=146919 RepID=UPI002168C3B3|nr:hypothetical protein [Salinibacter ruber]MCS3824349.1 hypothetical protein [Salinibacter ruber]
MKKRGAYVLANDAVYEWTVAFLESFRIHNPDLPLYLIPFDDRCDEIVGEASEYQFETFEHESFNLLESIGEKLELGVTPTGPHWFRRFASFWGPLDEFIYLDCRMVVLADLEPLIQALDSYECDFLHFEGGLDQVYEPGPVRTALVREHHAQGFNSGRWVTKKGLFSRDQMQDVATELVRRRDQMNRRNTDQFFLNYLVHTSDVRYASVHDLMPEVSRLTWPRIPGTVYRDACGYKVWSHGRPEHDTHVVLMHWAGIERSPGMECRWLFRRYWLHGKSVVEKMMLWLRELVLMPVLVGERKLRQSQWVHRIYELLRDG